jgi:hypothetical protein
MSSSTMSMFDSSVDKQLDLHGLFYKFCSYRDNNIHIDSRYFKLLIKYKIDIQLLQDYICNIVEKVLLNNSKYEIHANAESLSIFDFEKYKIFIHEMTNAFRIKFTNRLDKCYLYNTSVLFKLMHGFFKRVMSKEDLDCIIFVKDE